MEFLALLSLGFMVAAGILLLCIAISTNGTHQEAKKQTDMLRALTAALQPPVLPPTPKSETLRRDALTHPALQPMRPPGGR